MNEIYRITSTLFLCATLSMSFAQVSNRDTLTLSRQHYEELFLKQNLLLIAGKYNIHQADALLLQSKLWPNPSISIEDVNLWATKKQLSSLDNPLPPIFGKTAENTQFSIQLEQLIQTAGKRKKLIAMDEVSVDQATQEFGDLLRNLKYEFRNNLSRLEYLHKYQTVFIKQQKSVQNLVQSYQKQVDNNNFSKPEFLRLQVLSLELSKEIFELARDLNEVEMELKIALNIEDSLSLSVKYEIFTSVLKGISVEELIEKALESRPDLRTLSLNHQLHKKTLDYEKALRVPDVNVMSSYDRGGGIWPSFFSVGIAMDIPLFNRNQGNIKHAELGVNQSDNLLKEKYLRVKSEVIKGHNDVVNAVELYESIVPDNQKDIEVLLENYTQNFVNRNLSLLEYLDFQSAYLDNKKMIFESERDVHLLIEALKYIIGTEIN